MADEKRASVRINVSIKMSCADAAEGALHVHDLSSGGFLASGRVSFGVGDRLSASIHLCPVSGECDVGLSGTVMRAVQDGEERVIGVRIDEFASADGEKAYRDFVRELEEDQ